MMPALLIKISIRKSSGQPFTSAAAWRTDVKEPKSSRRHFTATLGTADLISCSASKFFSCERPARIRSEGSCREIARAVSKPRPPFVTPVMRTRAGLCLAHRECNQVFLPDFPLILSARALHASSAVVSNLNGDIFNMVAKKLFLRVGRTVLLE